MSTTFTGPCERCNKTETLIDVKGTGTSAYGGTIYAKFCKRCFECSSGWKIRDEEKQVIPPKPPPLEPQMIKEGSAKERLTKSEREDKIITAFWMFYVLFTLSVSTFFGVWYNNVAYSFLSLSICFTIPMIMAFYSAARIKD